VRAAAGAVLCSTKTPLSSAALFYVILEDGNAFDELQFQTGLYVPRLQHAAIFLTSLLACSALSRYRMTGMVLGRPTSPTSRPVTEVGLTIIIMFAIVTIPFVAAKAVRLYVETLELTVFKGDAAAPHIIVTGDVTEARIRAFLAQLYHESRRFAIQIGPRVVILSPRGSTAGLLELIDQTRFSGNITFIKGSALNQGDLARASASNASTMLFLTSRLEQASVTDAVTLAACLSAKSYNPRLRLLVQLRQQRTQQQIATIPAWSHEDRSIVLPNFTHTLLGVGALVPGLPALVAMLIQQGSGTAAEKALKQRHGSSWGAMSSQLAFTGGADAREAVGGESRQQRSVANLWPLDVMQQVRSVLDDHVGEERWSLARAGNFEGSILSSQPQGNSTNSATPRSFCSRPQAPNRTPRAISLPADSRCKLLLGTGCVLDERGITIHIAMDSATQRQTGQVTQMRQPWQLAIGKSPLQEFAAGFSQELHEVRLTPGLAFRSFGAAARLVYLRYHILLLAARVRSGTQQKASKEYCVPPAAPHVGAKSSSGHQPAFSTDVRLFPCKLLLDPSAVVSLYAVAPSEEAVARLQQDTGDDWLRVMRYSSACLQQGIAPSPVAPPLSSQEQELPEKHRYTWKEDRERVLDASSWAYHWFGLPHSHALSLAKAEFNLASPWPWMRMTDSYIHPRRPAVQRPLCYGTCCASLFCCACASYARQADEETVWNRPHTSAATKTSDRPTSASMALYSAPSGAPSMQRGFMQVVPPLALSDPASLPSQYRRRHGTTTHLRLGDAAETDEVGIIGLSHSVTSDVLSAFSSRGSAGAASAPPAQHSPSSQAAHAREQLPGSPTNQNKQTRPSLTSSAARSPGRVRASSTASEGAGGAAGIGGSLSTTNRMAPTSAPNALRDHILICGANINMGLLLRSLKSVPYDPPFCTHRVFLKPASQGGTAETLIGRGMRVEEHQDVDGDGDSVASFTSLAPGRNRPPPQLHWKVVVLCPKQHRPDFASDSKLSGFSSSWLAQVQWIDGSPLALEDLVRAGALSARSAIVLANDGGFRGGGAASSPLLDDVDAISVASGLYKLNPNLHVVTQLQHGSSATFLRPSGSSLSSAQEFTTEYVSQLTQQIQGASEKFARQMAQQRARRAAAELAIASVAGSVQQAAPEPDEVILASPSQVHAAPTHPKHASLASNVAAIPEANESDERDSDEQALSSGTQDAQQGAAAGAGLTMAGMPLAGVVVGSSLAAAQEALRGVQRDRQRADASDSSDSDVCGTNCDEQAPDVYSISSDSDVSPAAAAVDETTAAMASPLQLAEGPPSPHSSSSHPKSHRRGWSLLRTLVQDGKEATFRPVVTSPQAKAAVATSPGSNALSEDGQQVPGSNVSPKGIECAPEEHIIAPVSRAGILDVLSDVVTSGALEGKAEQEQELVAGSSAAQQGTGVNREQEAPASQPSMDTSWKPPPAPSANEQKQVLRDIVKLAAKSSTAEAIGEQLLEHHLLNEEKRTRELEMLALGSDAQMAAAALDGGSAGPPVQIAGQDGAGGENAPDTAADGMYGDGSHRGSLTADDLNKADPPWAGLAAAGSGSSQVSLYTATDSVHPEPLAQPEAHPTAKQGSSDVMEKLGLYPFTKLFQEENATCEVAACGHLALETCAAQACDTHLLSGAAVEAASIAERLGAPAATRVAIRAHMAGFSPGVAPGSTHRPSAREAEVQAAERGNPSDESFKALDENMQSGNESIGDKLFTSKTSQQARRAARAAAEADLFGAPAFAAGRAFSATTLDALVVESFYTPHAISLVKRLVRASRKQRLQLVPAQEALFMVRWFSPSFTTLQQAAHADAQAGSGDRLPPTYWPMENQQWPLVRFGQMSEALLRGWHLLSLGLYRRRSPPVAAAVGMRSTASYTGSHSSPNPDQQAADLLEGQLPSTDGPFKHSRELISYVYTNPPPHTILTPHDYVYVLRAHGED